MQYYLLFVIVMPVLVYIDYYCYKKKTIKVLESQPDYESNRTNYDLLFEKLCAGQKKVSTTVCVILCLAALCLGMMFIFASS